MLQHWQTHFLAPEKRQVHKMMSYTSKKDKTLNDNAGRVSPGGAKEQVVLKLKSYWKAGEIGAYFIWTDTQFLVHSHGNHLGITWQLLNAPHLGEDPFIIESLQQSSCFAKCRHHQGWFKTDTRGHSKSCHLAKVKRGQHLLRDIMGLQEKDAGARKYLNIKNRLKWLSYLYFPETMFPVMKTLDPSAGATRPRHHPLNIHCNLLGLSFGLLVTLHLMKNPLGMLKGRF